MIQRGSIIGGRYQLLEAVGQGGMGTIWKARHVRLEQPVAVKFISSDILTSQLSKRFLREARAAASVKHRNVVEVIDFGMEGAVPYLVMEWLDGEPLDQRLGREPPPTVNELVRIVADILVGLSAVHAAGVIHRDLKPANIFLVGSAEGAYPKIVDFGVSRLATTLATGSALTQSGQIIGTPLYMAPEQLRGGKHADQTSDLYSIGVVLFEALTGHPPFSGANLVDLIVAVSTERPPRLASIRPDLPQALCDVVDRALTRDTSARFASAASMRRALEGSVNEDGILPLRGELALASTVDAATPATLPSTADYVAARPPWRSRLLPAALLLGVPMMVGGAYLFVSWRSSAHQPDSESAAPRQPVIASTPSTDAQPVDAGKLRHVRISAIRVHLVDLPANATVLVDAEPRETVSPLRLPRVNRTYELEVRVPGRGAWRHRHSGLENGRYSMVFAEGRPAASATKRSRRRPARRRPIRRDAGALGVPPPSPGATLRNPYRRPDGNNERRPPIRSGELANDPGF